MVTQNAESSQGDGGTSSAPYLSADQLRTQSGNVVFKSGPLFISSKGIGWTSWKKRWFVLTHTSLVFFRSDPSAGPQREGEVNNSLGRIELNQSASVTVKEDKKLLTVLFPDARDGRNFTLKAETSEELHDWKTAFDNALAQAPSAAAFVKGQSGISRSDVVEAVEGSPASEQSRDKQPVKSSVIGRPILLALEEIDGSPSFLEKALTFIEQYGIKVEGILRQSADVEEVERRVQEFEQGKNEFSPEEDAHVISDCVKHVLRAMPSYPVPVACCSALLDAYRTGRGTRINAMRASIYETFPEPNRRLLQRILKMMQTVASHKSQNRMTTSALAACMAPLLLRPLLAGDCEIEDRFDMGGDGSAQLLQAAAAANHAHAIVATLLEAYEYIFVDDCLLEGSFSSELYSESEYSGSGDGDGDAESTDDGLIEDGGYHDAQVDPDLETEDDGELSDSLSESSGDGGSEPDDNKMQVLEALHSDSNSPEVNEHVDANKKPADSTHTPLPRDNDLHSGGNLQGIPQPCNDFEVNNKGSSSCSTQSNEAIEGVITSASPMIQSTDNSPPSSITKSVDKLKGPMPIFKRSTIWGRTSARKNLSMELIDYHDEDEIAIQSLESTKVDLQKEIASEEKVNKILRESLEARRKTSQECRLSLEQDVSRLQEQLQRERDLRETLEAGVNIPLVPIPISSHVDVKIRVEIEEITLAEAEIIKLRRKVADLRAQLNQQPQPTYGSVCESCRQYQRQPDHPVTEIAQQKYAMTTASSHNYGRLPKSEEKLGGDHNENIRTRGPSALPDKQPLPKQQPDSTVQSKEKSTTFFQSKQEKLGGDHNENGKTRSSSSLPDKQPLQRQQTDSTIQSKEKSTGHNENARTRGSSSLPDKQPLQKQQPDSTTQNNEKSIVVAPNWAIVPVITLVPDSASKRSSAKGEGTVSALTNLASRFNFMKERRSHPNELHSETVRDPSSERNSHGPGPTRTNSR